LNNLRQRLGDGHFADAQATRYLRLGLASPKNRIDDLAFPGAEGIHESGHGRADLVGLASIERSPSGIFDIKLLAALPTNEGTVEQPSRETAVQKAKETGAVSQMYDITDLFEFNNNPEVHGLLSQDGLPASFGAAVFRDPSRPPTAMMPYGGRP
jgi:hypothetical protein